MTTRCVYLAGGINGLSDSDASDWRTEIKALIPREIAVIDPMSRDYRGKEDDNVDDIVKGDLSDIAKSDVMIAYCPRPSWGTAMEIHHVATDGRYVRVADNAGVLHHTGYRRVIAVVPDGVPVSPWLRYYSDTVVSTLEDAVAAL